MDDTGRNTNDRADIVNWVRVELEEQERNSVILWTRDFQEFYNRQKHKAALREAYRKQHDKETFNFPTVEYATYWVRQLQQ